MIDLAPGFQAEGPTRLAAVLAAIGRATEPDAPPDWLLPSQRRPFRRAMAIVRRHGGVMLALPVGTGKTFVSLAVARASHCSAVTTVVAPAVTREQWLAAAKRVGSSVIFSSHEAVSRGVVPGEAGPVIIDESHRFRTATTRRYRNLAPALVGRTVVLSTATPIVNRATDLVNQLLLAVPDDALAMHGLPSLRALATSDRPAFLDEIVVGDEPSPETIPSAVVRHLAADPDPSLDRVLEKIGSLRLSRDPAVRQLLRVSMLRALASSPAALAAVVNRYRRLLAHASRARGAGHRLNRRQVLSLVGPAPDQLVMWELLPRALDAPIDLALSDRPSLESLTDDLGAWRRTGDAKFRQLIEILADGQVTAVFTGSIATAEAVKHALAVPGVVWVTGSRAGLGPLRLPRATALAGFDSAGTWAGRTKPWLLIATDVAAEGLNLDRVRRVVHYDLPWTAVRLAQRVGRARRITSQHRSVDVVQFGLPPALEDALAIEAAITRKGRLPQSFGLGSHSEPWRDRLDELSRSEEPVTGWAVARDGPSVAAVTRSAEGPAELWTELPSGEWTRDRRAVEVAMTTLGTAPESGAPRAARLVQARVSLGRAIAFEQHREAVRDLVAPRRQSTGVATVTAQATGLARERRWTEAALAGPTLGFLRRGHRSGEAAVARRLALGGPAAWVTVSEPPEATRPALVAVVLVDRQGGDG